MYILLYIPILHFIKKYHPLNQKIFAVSIQTNNPYYECKQMGLKYLRVSVKYVILIICDTFQLIQNY